MVKCPECKTDNPTPTRIWKILDEPNPMGRFSERSVGIFQCNRCGVTFPNVVGRIQYAIVRVDKYLRMKEEIKTLKEKISKITEDTEISEMQATVLALEKEVSELRKEKMELENKLS